VDDPSDGEGQSNYKADESSDTEEITPSKASSDPATYERHLHLFDTPEPTSMECGDEDDINSDTGAQKQNSATKVVQKDNRNQGNITTPARRRLHPTPGTDSSKKSVSFETLLSGEAKSPPKSAKKFPWNHVSLTKQVPRLMTMAMIITEKDERVREGIVKDMVNEVLRQIKEVPKINGIKVRMAIKKRDERTGKRGPNSWSQPKDYSGKMVDYLSDDYSLRNAPRSSNTRSYFTFKVALTLPYSAVRPFVVQNLLTKGIYLEYANLHRDESQIMGILSPSLSSFDKVEFIQYWYEKRNILLDVHQVQLSGDDNMDPSKRQYHKVSYIRRRAAQEEFEPEEQPTSALGIFGHRGFTQKTIEALQSTYPCRATAQDHLYPNGVKLMFIRTEDNGAIVEPILRLKPKISALIASAYTYSDTVVRKGGGNILVDIFFCTRRFDTTDDYNDGPDYHYQRYDYEREENV